MKFTKALRLSLTCWRTMLKSLVMQLCVLFLVVALSVFLFGNLTTEVLTAFENMGVSQTLSDFVQSVVSGTLTSQAITRYVAELTEGLSGVIEAIPNLFNRIEFAYAIFVLILCLLYVLVTLPSMPVNYALGEFMQTNAKRPITWYVFKKLRKNIGYVCYRMIYEGIFNMLILFSFVGFYIMSSIVMSHYAVYFALFIAIVLFSAKSTLLAFWLPTLTTNEWSVRRSMSQGIATVITRFWHVFYKLIIVNVIALEVVILLNYFFPHQATVAVSLLLLFVASYVNQCISMVEYFDATERKYFYKKLKSFDEVMA